MRSESASRLVSLAEIVAHDFHVPVGYCADGLGDIDADGPPRALAINPRDVRTCWESRSACLRD